MTRMASPMGHAGTCIYGFHTDTAEISKEDFPMWSHGASHVATRPYDTGGGFNRPVSISGTAILPGYVALADYSEVLFLPLEDLDKITEMAEEMTEKDRIGKERNSNGTHLGEMSGASNLVRVRP